MEKSLSKSLPQLRLVDGGSTLVHPDDIPFDIYNMPDIFTHFRKQVEGLTKMVREPDRLDNSIRFPDFPPEARTFLPNKEIDSLTTELTSASAEGSQSERSAIPFEGGEEYALNRIHHYLTESRAVENYKVTRNGLIGVDYSTKLSPFLAHGNISARHIYYLLKCHEKQFMNGRSSKNTYWVVFELLWRDFWKFLVRKTGNQVFYLEGRDHDVIQRSWSTDREVFQKWREGVTGIPFIDANMREIATTG